MTPFSSSESSTGEESAASEPKAPESRLAETLKGLDFCIEQVRKSEGVSLGLLMDQLASASFCFVSLLLATPFIQPISLGPLTMASGGVFILVGWQMGRGRDHLILPQRVRAWILRGGAWVAVLTFCRRLLIWLAKFTKPRFSGWVDGIRGEKNIGWLIFAGGILLAIPCANLPFNNTLPALMIFFAALAWLERDGLMAVISLIWGGLTLVYFAATIILVWWLGAGAWGWLTGWMHPHLN